MLFCLLAFEMNFCVCKKNSIWFYTQRIRISLFDAKNASISRIFEYVQKMPRLEERDERDTLWLSIDDADQVERKTLYGNLRIVVVVSIFIFSKLNCFF